MWKTNKRKFYFGMGLFITVGFYDVITHPDFFSSMMNCLFVLFIAFASYAFSSFFFPDHKINSIWKILLVFVVLPILFKQAFNGLFHIDIPHGMARFSWNYGLLFWLLLIPLLKSREACIR